MTLSGRSLLLMTSTCTSEVSPHLIIPNTTSIPWFIGAIRPQVCIGASIFMPVETANLAWGVILTVSLA